MCIRDRVRAFLTRNSKVFSESEFDIGRTHLVEHKIETDDSKPVRQALRRHPVAYLPLIDEYVQGMQDSGIIEPRIGPNGSPISCWSVKRMVRLDTVSTIGG